LFQINADKSYFLNLNKTDVTLYKVINIFINE